MDHFEGALRLYGERRAPRIMRKVGIRYARLHPTPSKIRMAFVEVKNAREWHEVLQTHYNSDLLVPQI